MSRALRVISVERGLDPRDFALVAFGGAGGMHACALAEELGMRAGADAARRRRAERARAGDVGRAARLRAPAAVLARRDSSASTSRSPRWRRRRARTCEDPELRRLADLRYRRQSFELTVRRERPGRARRALPRGARPALRLPHGRGARAGRQRARDRHGAGRQARALRGRAVRRRLPPRPGGSTSTATGSRRTCSTAREMGRGSRVEGPAIVEFAEATCAVRPGWSGRGGRRGHAGVGT